MGKAPSGSIPQNVFLYGGINTCMANYKILNLPHVETIKQKVLPLLPEHAYSSSWFFQVPEISQIPELVEAVSMVRPWDQVEKIAVISAMPYCHIVEKNTYIHVDVMYNQEKAVGLNFPIYNCEDTFCAMYEATRPVYYKESEYADGSQFHATHLMRQSATEIERFSIPNQAYLFNHQVPHGVINTTKQSRIVLSVRFSSDIDIDSFSV